MKKYLIMFLFTGLLMSFFNSAWSDNKFNLNLLEPEKKLVYFGIGGAGSIPSIRFPIVSEPYKISGYRLSMQSGHIFPDCANLTLLLETSFANWSSSQSNISILAIAPILRYQFFFSRWINSFIDLSIGPAYLSKTMFVHNNLGIHYSFQDMVGLGFKMGEKQNLALSWRITHYSNAGLSKHNRGITIPIILSLEYYF